MEIAIIGWGSLFQNPGILEAGPFHEGGPTLPIDFARVSQDGRLTLVVDETLGTACPTYVARSDHNEIPSTVKNLADREGCKSTKHIHFFSHHDEQSMQAHKTTPLVVKTISEWLLGSQYDAAVWTGLPSNFTDRSLIGPFTVPNAIQYLASLSGDKQQRAFDYIRRAPEKISTPLRDEFNLQWPE